MCASTSHLQVKLSRLMPISYHVAHVAAQSHKPRVAIHGPEDPLLSL